MSVDSRGYLGSDNDDMKTAKIIMDKVLVNERSTAYASTIDDINEGWLDCKECNWYKSEQSILSEARFSKLNLTISVVMIILFIYLDPFPNVNAKCYLFCS